MSERKIVAAALNSREAFGVIQRDMAENDLTPKARKVIDILAQLYGRSKSIESVDRETFEDWVETTVENPKHAADFNSYVSGLPEGVDPMSIAALVNAQRARSLRLQLAEKLQTGEDYSPLLRELQEVESPLSAEEDELVDLSDYEQFMADMEKTSLENRIRLWPPALQKRTDGADPGHHIAYFGRPGIGKTLMTINSVGGHLHDGYRVLYIGNEDPIAVIRRRICVRLARTDYDRYDKDPGSFHAKLQEEGIGNLRSVRLTPGTPYEIERLIKRTNPDIMVIDQLRNMSVAGMEGASTAAKMDAAAQEVRNLLGKYSLVGYSIAQAGAGPEGKNDDRAFLGKADIDNSKTGLPGATDLLVGIGCTEQMKEAHERGISLIKNKLKGDHEGDQFYVTYTENENRVQ